MSPHPERKYDELVLEHTVGLNGVRPHDWQTTPSG
jgi:hypothetical protein